MDDSGNASVTDLWRRPVRVACLICLIGLAWQTYRFNWVIDDAFISFRYAKHLAQGHGLRWNVGETPPVEGYSNPLWVLALAPFEAIGWPSPVVSRVLSAVCGAILLCRVVRLLNQGLGLSLLPLTLCGAFLATFPPAAAWSTSGMAMMPYALLMFLTFEFLLADADAPRGLPAGVAAALLILVRADGMVWVAGMIALSAALAVMRRDRAAIKPILTCSLLAAVTLGALTAFRMSYFGWPLPNTVYSKVGLCAMTLERGGRYLLEFLLAFPHVALLVAAAAIVSARDRQGRTLGLLATTMTVGSFGYVVLVGGDWMPMCRLLVPALPFVALLLGVVLKRLSPWPTAAAGCGVAAIVLSLLPGYNLHPVPHSVRDRLDFHYADSKYASEYERWSESRNATGVRTEFARILERHTKPGESIVRDAIGAIGYYTDLFIYDRIGLVSVEIAHRQAPRGRLPAGHDKMVGREYFLKYRPTYYLAKLIPLPQGMRGTATPGRRLRFRGEVPLSDRFPAEAKATYEPVAYPILRPGERKPRMALLLFMRKDLL